MATLCSKCGAAIEPDWPVCRSCFEPIKREGFLARLARFFSRVSVSSSPPRVSINLSERIKIRDRHTGELHEYKSLDEVPPDIREQIRKAREAALTKGRAETITVTNASGKVQTYHSVDELPPEIRELYRKARGLS